MAWKEVRLPVAEYLAEVCQNPRLDLLQRGRLALAWMHVWLLEDYTEASWRKALGYTAMEWEAVREAFADVLDRGADRWSLVWMERELARQKRLREQQADLGRRGGLAKASRRLANASERLGPASDGLAKSGPASASASDSKALAPNGAAKGPKEIRYTPEFEAFWAEYRCVRRTGKPQAFREWVAAGGQRIHEQIMAALVAYKASAQWRDGFMKEPTGWLKKRPWEDGPVAAEDPAW